MSGKDEYPRGDSEFECQGCGRRPDFWYVIGYSYNGFKMYGILRSLSEGARNGDIRLSIVKNREDDPRGELTFFQRTRYPWQLKCPLCQKAHSGNFKAHKQAREIIRELLPTQFRCVVLSEVL